MDDVDGQAVPVGMLPTERVRQIDSIAAQMGWFLGSLGTPALILRVIDVAQEYQAALQVLVDTEADPKRLKERLRNIRKIPALRQRLHSLLEGYCNHDEVLQR